MTRVPVTLKWVDKLWPIWVGARVSNRTIYVAMGTYLTPALLAHELMHVLQRDRLGPWFLCAYLLGWMRAGFRYHLNPMEVEARKAERDPDMLSWAEDLLGRP